MPLDLLKKQVRFFSMLILRLSLFIYARVSTFFCVIILHDDGYKPLFVKFEFFDIHHDILLYNLTGTPRAARVCLRCFMSTCLK